MSTPVIRLIGFYVALTHFLILVSVVAARVYFIITGDSDGERHFALNTIWLFPVWALTWFAGTVMVRNDLLESRRITWRGFASLILLTPTAMIFATIVITSFWQFAVQP